MLERDDNDVTTGVETPGGLFDFVDCDIDPSDIRISTIVRGTLIRVQNSSGTPYQMRHTGLTENIPAFYPPSLADSSWPNTDVTSPPRDSNQTLTITLAGTGFDNIGVDRVEFWLDGVLVYSDSSFPYQTTTFNTRTLSNGIHFIFTRVYDTAGNFGNSVSLNFSTNN